MTIIFLLLATLHIGILFSTSKDNQNPIQGFKIHIILFPHHQLKKKTMIVSALAPCHLRPRILFFYIQTADKVTYLSLKTWDYLSAKGCGRLWLHRIIFYPTSPHPTVTRFGHFHLFCPLKWEYKRHTVSELKL